jgi:hypothetical protein
LNTSIPSRAKQVAKLVLFALSPLAILLIAGHVAASLITARSLAFEVDSLTGVTWYRTRVGSFPWSHRSATRMNTMGFPDEEYANLPAKGSCFHVVLAGDSFTFGDVTDGEKSWVSLLRDRLATRHRGRCFRVFNIAAPVTSIFEQAKRIRETMELLQPDAVLLGQYQNDITDLTNFGSIAYLPTTQKTNTTNWGDRIRQTIPGFDSPLPRLVTYNAFKVLIELDVRVDVLNRWSVLADSSNSTYAEWLTGIYGELYTDLVSELRERNVDFAVVILPSKMDLMAKRYPEGEYFERLARANSVPFLNVFDALDAQRRPMPYYVYDGHLDERGNRIVSEAVYEWLITGAEAPLPRLREAAGPIVPLVPVLGFPK